MAKSLQTSPAALSDDALRDVLEELQGAAADQVITTGTLAIGASSKAKIKNTAAAYVLVDGICTLVAIAEHVVAGTVVNATFNVYQVTANSAGTVAVAMGTAGASLAAVVFPTVPDDQVVLGFAIVNPTGTGNFVGGTTEFDDATVVPNAVFVSCTGGFNPNLVTL